MDVVVTHGLAYCPAGFVSFAKVLPQSSLFRDKYTSMHACLLRETKQCITTKQNNIKQEIDEKEVKLRISVSVLFSVASVADQGEDS